MMDFFLSAGVAKHSGLTDKCHKIHRYCPRPRDRLPIDYRSGLVGKHHYQDRFLPVDLLQNLISENGLDSVRMNITKPKSIFRSLPVTVLPIPVVCICMQPAQAEGPWLVDTAVYETSVDGATIAGTT